ncbi:hypothetical protein QTP88_016561 [Uroleucon formosanum]
MAIICPIFKKNDPKQVANYRGISLLDVEYKVLSSLLLGRLQNNTQNVVRIIGEISEPFIVKNGLRQGDALSPVLFNLPLEEIIRSLPRGQRMEVNEGYICLAYADDLVLLGDTRQDVIQILSNLMKASKQMGLSVNQEKTKYMFLSRKTKNEEDMKDLEVDGLTFQQVNSFKYLGVNVNNTNCMHEEIKLRLQSANKAYFAMLSLFKSSEQKWLRRSNEDLKNLYLKENIVQFVRSSRLAWAGHAWRADGSLIKMVMVNQIDLKRPRGRPRQKWLDAVRRDIEELKSDWNGNLDLAYARDVWGELVLEAKSLNGS